MADMDFEMDLDLGFTAEDLEIPAGDITTAEETTLTVCFVFLYLLFKADLQ